MFNKPELKIEYGDLFGKSIKKKIKESLNSNDTLNWNEKIKL